MGPVRSARWVIVPDDADPLESEVFYHVGRILSWPILLWTLCCTLFVGSLGIGIGLAFLSYPAAALLAALMLHHAVRDARARLDSRATEAAIEKAVLRSCRRHFNFVDLLLALPLVAFVLGSIYFLWAELPYSADTGFRFARWGYSILTVSTFCLLWIREARLFGYSVIDGDTSLAALSPIVLYAIGAWIYMRTEWWEMFGQPWGLSRSGRLWATALLLAAANLVVLALIETIRRRYVEPRLAKAGRPEQPRTGLLSGTKV